MKKLSLLAIGTLAFIASSVIHAQVTAVTEYGDTIYVYDNGRWSFQLDDPPIYEAESTVKEWNIKVDTVAAEYSTPALANEKLTSRYSFYEVSYDDSAWRRVPSGQLNEDAEYAFVGKDADIYCLAIPEESEMTKEAILRIALDNAAEGIGSKPELLMSELRTVNGVPVINGRFSIDMNGLNVIFNSYYYADDRGTLQFITWCAANVFEKYLPVMESMLNGLEIKE